jgi:class 3 adenylate cyclase
MTDQSFHGGPKRVREYACTGVRRASAGRARERMWPVRSFGMDSIRPYTQELSHVAGESELVLLVTDLAGFTPLVEELGDERARAVMRLHNALLRKHLREHAGIEVTHTGDGIIACFRCAPEAVHCAMRIQSAVASINAQSPDPAMHVRIGIHQGAPLLEEDRLFGAAVVAAVRICSRCEPDHILASTPVRTAARMLSHHFRSRGEHELKGFSGRFELFDVRWSEPQPE